MSLLSAEEEINLFFNFFVKKKNEKMFKQLNFLICSEEVQIHTRNVKNNACCEDFLNAKQAYTTNTKFTTE